MIGSFTVHDGMSIFGLGRREGLENAPLAS